MSISPSRSTLAITGAVVNEPQQIISSPDSLLINAPAKINLALLIAGRRPDGFHEIKTIMAKVTWYDQLLLTRTGKTGIELECAGRYPAPTGTENSVYRACRMLCQKAGIEPAINLKLTKNLPAAAGLGSASSDAAAALIGLNRLAGLGFTKDDLTHIAANIGADVPFFLNGPLALCTGKGEKIKKIEKIFNFLAILILPNVNVPTKRVYDNYQHDAALFDRLNQKITRHLSKNRIDLAAAMCANMLSKSCFDLYSPLADFKRKVQTLIEEPVCLSGSGSAMFSIIQGGDQRKANEYCRLLNDNVGCRTVIVTSNRW